MTNLLCGNNPLNNISISNNTELYQLEIGNTNLTSLELSNLTNITSLVCNNNNLNNLNVSPIQNLNFLVTTGNANLNCIEVNLQQQGLINNNTIEVQKDNFTQISLDCN